MSSKRILKREINNMVLDVVGECFHIEEADPSKTKSTEALFDKVADFQDVILQEIHQAKSKEEFRSIVEKVNKMHDELTDDLNKL